MIQNRTFHDNEISLNNMIDCYEAANNCSFFILRFLIENILQCLVGVVSDART